MACPEGRVPSPRRDLAVADRPPPADADHRPTRQYAPQRCSSGCTPPARRLPDLLVGPRRDPCPRPRPRPRPRARPAPGSHARLARAHRRPAARSPAPSAPRHAAAQSTPSSKEACAHVDRRPVAGGRPHYRCCPTFNRCRRGPPPTSFPSAASAALATSCTAEPDRPWRWPTLSLNAAFPYIKEPPAGRGRLRARRRARALR